jgi:DNA-binding transcriptional ArsR family regulator
MLDRNVAALDPPLDADLVSGLAKALAHPARVRIIAFLLSKPGCIGGDIVDQVGLAQSTVSEHLRILKDAGIVTGTIDYPRVCYSLSPSALVPIRDLIEAIAARLPEGDAPCCYTPDGCVPKETA